MPEAEPGHREAGATEGPLLHAHNLEPAHAAALGTPQVHARRLRAVVSDFLQAVVLGVIQGLTEFLPISSSAHLRIFPELFGWGDPGAAFTAVIQIGTELAVLHLLPPRHLADRHRLGALAGQAGVPRPPSTRRMGWYIILGSLPIVLLGVAAQGRHRVATSAACGSSARR